ncbi:hypothetical protein AR457_40760 [Streptomyces agglomeratus]|nr:hypothetical protein AR457_40760 [Streptomyces agglomeratus]
MFALEWIQAVGRDDAESVWPRMTPDFRLAMAQAWLSRNPAALDDPQASGLDRDSLARALAASSPELPLFPHLSRVSLREIRNSYGNLRSDQLGMASRPRPVGPDLELMRLLYLPDLDVDSGGNYSLAPGAFARAANVILRRGGQAWAVAGVGDHFLRPGWPPVLERVVQPED